MFKALHNELRLQFLVEAAGPLVIRAGKPSGIDPTRPDMEFVRDGAGQVFLPGSSLKGVMRSRAERILRSLRPEWACIPFRDACGQGLQKQAQDGELRYRGLCLACRLFGSVALRGRAAFADAPAVDPAAVKLGERNHVGIDRVTGGPARTVLFKPEVVEAGTFRAEVVLTNFALWQVLLVAAVLRDMDEGWVGIGGATTRGYGRVRVPAGAVGVRWRDGRADGPASLRGFRREDVAPGPAPVAFARALYGWEAAWEGLDPLLAGLAGLRLEQAVARDFPMAGGGSR